MATAASRHRHAPQPQPRKSLPIVVPSKPPPHPYPVSRVARSPPEFSDTSTTYSSGRHSAGSYSVHSNGSASSDSSGEYERYDCTGGVDMVDMLTDRFSALNPIKMDQSIVIQAQTSGLLNAKQRELAELQALTQRRLKTARVNFAEGIEAARETRHDLDYTTKKVAAMKAKVAQRHPEAYAKASRSRHAD